MRVLWLLVSLTLTGCVSLASVFTCTDSSECTVGGICQPDGFCSFPNTNCESGQAYGDASGGLSGTCVPPTAVTCNNNGTVDIGENCDDADQDATDSCVDCAFARCGDGKTRAGIEDCDDGNTADGDACNSICLDCTGDASVVTNGRCYMRIDTARDWDAAAADCVARGGALASINSAAENATITALLPATGDFWIGLDDEDEGNFFWQDDEQPGFLNFAAGEGVANIAENCSSVAGTVGTWTDRACTVTLPYVCERVPWTIDTTTRHAYLYVGGVAEEVYADAQTACTGLGAHLVSITDQTEQTAVDAISGATKLWIGLNDIAIEGTYVWEGGEPTGFFAWNVANAEPNNSGDCVTFRMDGTWQDELCDDRPSGFICEVDP